ncbi:MAG: hypothetical protein WAU42_09375 [Solirubrobacteraceae bacterium]
MIIVGGARMEARRATLRRCFVLPGVLLLVVCVLLAVSATASAGMIVRYTGHIKAFVPTWQGGTGPLITPYGHYTLELSWSESAEIDLSYADEKFSIPAAAWHFETLQGTTHYDQEGLEEAFAKVGVKVVAKKECTATLSLSPGFSEALDASQLENGETSVTAELPFASGAMSSSDGEQGSECSAPALESHGPQRSFYYIEEENSGGSPVIKPYLAAYLAKITGRFFEVESPPAMFNYAYTINQPPYDGMQGEVALTSSLSVSPGTEPPPLKVEFPDGESPHITPPGELLPTSPTSPTSGGPPPPGGKPSEEPEIEGKPKPREGRTGEIGGVEIKCPPKDVRDHHKNPQADPERNDRDRLDLSARRPHGSPNDQTLTSGPRAPQTAAPPENDPHRLDRHTQRRKARHEHLHPEHYDPPPPLTPRRAKVGRS